MLPFSRKMVLMLIWVEPKSLFLIGPLTLLVWSLQEQPNGALWDILMTIFGSPMSSPMCCSGPTLSTTPTSRSSTKKILRRSSPWQRFGTSMDFCTCPPNHLTLSWSLLACQSSIATSLPAKDRQIGDKRGRNQIEAYLPGVSRSLPTGPNLSALEINPARQRPIYASRTGKISTISSRSVPVVQNPMLYGLLSSSVTLKVPEPMKNCWQPTSPVRRSSPVR